MVAVAVLSSIPSPDLFIPTLEAMLSMLLCLMLLFSADNMANWIYGLPGKWVQKTLRDVSK